MDPSNSSKRARSEAGSVTSRTETPSVHSVSTPVSPPRDPVLEEEMHNLGVDEDFKSSLRSMSPNTRRDVMNDIIRTQHVGRMQQMFSLRTSPALDVSRLVPLDRRARVSIDSHDEEEDTDNDTHDGDDVNSFLLDLSRDVGSRGDQLVNIRERILRRMLQQLMPSQSRVIFGGEPFGFFNELSEVIAQHSMGLTQDIDEMSYEQLMELQERIGFVSKGITAEQKQQCVNEVERPKDGTCAVCQGEWQESSEDEKCVEVKTCKHIFHISCINEWLNSNKTCPLCMREVL